MTVWMDGGIYLQLLMCYSSCWWAGQRSRYSNWLRAGRSGDRIPVAARFSAPVQTGPEAHPASCTMDTGSFPGVKSGRGVMLTPHALIVPLVMKEQNYTSTPPMGRTACTEPQCLYKGCTLPLPLSASSLVFSPQAGLAGTRAQSGDRYGSGTLHPGQVAIAFPRLQTFPPSPLGAFTSNERNLRGQEMFRQIWPRIRLPPNSRDLLYAANLRHGTDGCVFASEGRRAEDFFSPGFGRV